MIMILICCDSKPVMIFLLLIVGGLVVLSFQEKALRVAHFFLFYKKRFRFKVVHIARIKDVRGRGRLLMYFNIFQFKIFLKILLIFFLSHIVILSRQSTLLPNMRETFPDLISNC